MVRQQLVVAAEQEKGLFQLLGGEWDLVRAQRRLETVDAEEAVAVVVVLLQALYDELGVLFERPI